ncbi:hypothetical protein KGM_205302 [Danaus plexippus plexippus]|uniref:Uncharacterized protein n=1 Tax=Danaus plexippus plexippus TaxID=278856 RepID=A0A212EQ39_DANPL|nr:hypothetical protein KGM_205302 [Danaus plexippus plexippus]
MFDKILESTRQKSCSCPKGKICSACRSKKVIPPQVIVEEPNRLPAPISITYYRPSKPLYQNNPHIQYVEKPKHWKIRKKTKYEPQPSRCMNVCRWYKRNKARRELKREYEKEKEREKERKRAEIEREMLKELIYIEEAKKQTQYVPPKTTPPKKTVIKKTVSKKTAPKKTAPKKAAPKYVKESSAYVKPKARSKYVTIKKKR